VIVLDTQAWVWWQTGNRRIPRGTLALIERAPWIAVPTACCLELSTLVRRERIRLDRDVRVWIRRALADERVEAVELTSEIAIEAGRLPESFPGDPVDRIVYATARALDCDLVSSDRRIRAHDSRRVIW
jgi:PIN domain nuclease of toxin-antitoxin system